MGNQIQSIENLIFYNGEKEFQDKYIHWLDVKSSFSVKRFEKICLKRRRQNNCILIKWVELFISAGFLVHLFQTSTLTAKVRDNYTFDQSQYFID